jgi:Concanavalin A-like lectin/glucanases superfamily
MRFPSTILALAATCLVTNAFAQIIESAPGPEPSVCSSGLQPDGFIDWSGLPAAPVLGINQTSSPITATLPVIGVPGLTVAVAIPALTIPFDGPTGPAWTVLGDKLHLSSLGAEETTQIGLAFNKPVHGLSLETNNVNFLPFVASITGGGPLSYGSVAGTSAFTYSPSWSDAFYPEGAPLQLRLSQVPLSTATITISAVSGIHQFFGIDLTNLRVESSSAPDLAKGVPTAGLSLWLAGDTSVNGKLNSSNTWYDLSPVGQDATNPAAYPQPQTAPMYGAYSTSTCRPVYSFAGNEYLNFNRSINGLHQMTIVVVAKADQTPLARAGSSNAAIFWQENQRWGNTYLSPYAGYVTWRFGTTQTNTDHVYTRPTTSGGDLDITMAVHDGSTESLWINGEPVQQFTGNLPALSGTTGAALLGQGLSGTPFNGRMGEVLVWDRTLTDAERVRVHHYLKAKYGIR